MGLLLPGDTKPGRNRDRVGAAVVAPRSVEAEYRRALLLLQREVGQATRLIGKAINAGQTRAQVIGAVRESIARSRARYEQAAQALPASMARSLSAHGKSRVESIIKKTTGVEFVRVIDTPELAEEIATAKLRNAQLITKLPEEHWGRVVQAITDNYDGTLEGSLSQRLTEVNSMSKNRARLIARDQTAKLSGDLARVRQQDVGIESYIWRTSKDERVVGRPGGKYPRGSARHLNHYAREGKTFRWDAPPPDGHPGQPIQCRCRAEPIINMDRLNAQLI